MTQGHDQILDAALPPPRLSLKVSAIAMLLAGCGAAGKPLTVKGEQAMGVRSVLSEMAVRDHRREPAMRATDTDERGPSYDAAPRGYASEAGDAGDARWFDVRAPRIADAAAQGGSHP